MKRLSYFALSTTLLAALPLVPLLHGCSGGSSGSRNQSNTGLNLNLTQSNGSNFGNTLAELKKGIFSGSTTPEVINVDASRTLYDGPNGSNITKQADFRIVFKRPVTLTAGTTFQLGGENPAATVQVGYDNGPSIISPYEYAKIWGNFGLASGELTIESNTGGSIKIRLKNVVLSPNNPESENGARGTLTFNGTIQSTIPFDEN